MEVISMVDFVFATCAHDAKSVDLHCLRGDVARSMRRLTPDFTQRYRYGRKYRSE